MKYMFAYNQQFNQDISAWDVSRVRDMNVMFQGAHKFNQDLSAWDVSSVTMMRQMFRHATLFNQNLCSWASKSPKLQLKSNGYYIGNIFPDNSCPNSGYDPVLKSGTFEDPHIGSFCYACPLPTMTPSSLPP
jgi:surface protein